VVGSSLGGIVQNPLVARVAVVAPTSAMCVIRLDISPKISQQEASQWNTTKETSGKAT